MVVSFGTPPSPLGAQTFKKEGASRFHRADYSSPPTATPSPHSGTQGSCPRRMEWVREAIVGPEAMV